jgi:hypothetical protein
MEDDALASQGGGSVVDIFAAAQRGAADRNEKRDDSESQMSDGDYSTYRTL